MKKPVMRKAKGDGVDINLAIREGGEKTVLCVHGLASNCRCWDYIADSLLPDFTVIAMDLRGRGLSEQPASGYSPLMHIRDIAALLNDLGIEKTLIMGHSLGALITLLFSAEYPERVEKTVLVDGAGNLGPERTNAVLEGIKPGLDRLGRIFPTEAEYLDFIRSEPYIQPWNAVIEEYYRYEMEAVDGGFRCNISPEIIAEEGGNVRQISTLPHYSRLKKEVLILRATEYLLSEADTLLPDSVLQIMLDSIPQASSFDVRGTNHYGIVLQPHPERDEAIRAFLST